MSEPVRRLIKTAHPGLVKLMYSDLRYEKKIPFRDNFLLHRDISYNEKIKFDRFQNFIVMSRNYFEEEWEREDIITEIKGITKSRRKPSFENMSDDEFEAHAKVFLVTGFWPTPDEDSGIFEMFKKIDSGERFGLFFKINEQVHEKALFYALLTFAGKAVDLHSEDVSAGYLRVLKAKERVLSRNFIPALNNYSKYGDSLESDMKVLRFIYDLGQISF